MHQKALAYLTAVKQHLAIFPGVRELVRDVADRYPLAIASGALRNEIELILEEAGLRKAFRHITSAEDVTQGKPAPDPFLHALAGLNGQSERLCSDPWGLPGHRRFLARYQRGARSRHESLGCRQHACDARSWRGRQHHPFAYGNPALRCCRHICGERLKDAHENLFTRTGSHRSRRGLGTVRETWSASATNVTIHQASLRSLSWYARALRATASRVPRLMNRWAPALGGDGPVRIRRSAAPGGTARPAHRARSVRRLRDHPVAAESRLRTSRRRPAWSPSIPDDWKTSYGTSKGLA